MTAVAFVIGLIVVFLIIIKIRGMINKNKSCH